MSANFTCMTVVLPRLSGTPLAVAGLVAHTPNQLHGADIMYVDARAAVSVSRGFADEIVRELLVERNAGRVVLTGAPPRVQALFVASAHRCGAGSRLIHRTR